MPFSGLVSGVVLTPYCTAANNRKIDSVAIHTMGGNMSAENCGYWFATEKEKSAQASSNYGIGSDGKIFGYVDEDNISWCTSSTGVDKRSITIEVASLSSKEPFECSSEAYESLIRLLVDICQRYNFSLRWADDRVYASDAAKGGPVDKLNMFAHRWFNTGKSCPGDYLFKRMGDIADEVNRRLRKSGAKIATLNYSNEDNVSQYCIFIGDSRTVGMQNATTDRDKHFWFCQTGVGLVWFKKIASSVTSKISSGAAICILLGINDMLYTKPNQYSDFINECAESWVTQGASVYFVSINPVDETKYKNIRNSQIEKYNQMVRNGLSTNVGFIDTYSMLAGSITSSDGLHYDSNTYESIYESLLSAVQHSNNTSIICNSAVIGGSPIQVDYTKINPYIITIDRNTQDSQIYPKLHDVGVVGAILEAGSVYDKHNVKYQYFKQPKFDSQRKILESNNIPYGYFTTTRARSSAEASTEMKEFSSILRLHPPLLGVWVLFDLSNNKYTNDIVIDTYYDRLVKLGFSRKIGLIVPRTKLKKFSWDKYQEAWLLWIVDHVLDTTELQQLLTPEFFDIQLDEYSEET